MLEQSLRVIPKDSNQTPKKENIIADKSELISLLDRDVYNIRSSTFEIDEIVDFSKGNAKVIPYRGYVTFAVKNRIDGVVKQLPVYLFHRSRVLVKKDEECDYYLVTDERINNYDCEVGRFYNECPSVLVFIAALAGCKIICKRKEQHYVANFDYENNTLDFDGSHKIRSTFYYFDFVGEKPIIKEEWLGKGGADRAAEFIIKYFCTE